VSHSKKEIHACVTIMVNLTPIVIGIQSVTSFILSNYNSESSSDDDNENISNILKQISKRGPLIPKIRIKNYIENVIENLSNEGFKEHFR